MKSVNGLQRNLTESHAMPLDEWWRDYATHAFVKYASGHGSGCKGAELDKDAVERLIEILEREGKTEIIEAIKAVYFVDPHGKPEQKDIVSRATALSKEINIPPKRVYKLLKAARLLFAKLRELDTEIDDDAKN